MEAGANILAIVNPQSAGGKTARAFAGILPHIPRKVDVEYTEQPGHATLLAASALRQGIQTIIAVGGDGTINEVINGFFDRDKLVSPEARLALIPCGTGSDLRRGLNIPDDPIRAAALLETGRARPIDLMRVHYTTNDGRQATRYAANVTSFGMGGAVAARASGVLKSLGGRLSFLIATGLSALAFKGKTITMCIDGQPPRRQRVTNIIVGNGQYHGAGMWVCPKAAPDDGWLDLTIVQYMSIVEITRNLKVLYDGRIYDHPKVDFHKARHVTLESDETTLMEIDGEPLGRLPAEIVVVPRAIRVLR